MKKLLQKAKNASFAFGILPYKKRQQILLDIADILEENMSYLLKENAKDLAKMDLKNPLYDRLLLNKQRISDMAVSCREIATRQDCIGKILEERNIEEGMQLQKISVPLGVVACIYEARPNVTIDIAALCIITGNVSVLRGSSNAEYSNQSLISLIHRVFEKHGIEKEAISKYSVDRKDLEILFSATEEVDLLVPRGSQDLINRVRREAIVPTIETGAGVCHTFIDASANIDMAVDIVVNAKTQRPSVCNALDTCIIHKDISEEFYKKLLIALEPFSVKIWADQEAKLKFPENNLILQAPEGIWGKEFLGFEMSCKTVKNVGEAIEHINRYGSRHSEAIISENTENVQNFLQMVDASSVYHNASTRFTDGGCFGLGAEVGISTQKLHARGPMGAESLTSYKYIVQGSGQIRK